MMSNVPNFVKCTKLWTSSITPRTTCGGKISLFILKNSEADVCNYERSVWWTDASSQHHFSLTSAVQAKAGLCITEAEEWETSGGLYRDNSEYDQYEFVDDSLLQRQISLDSISQTIVKKIILSFFFPAISIGVYAYAFTQNVFTGVLFALLGWFFLWVI